MRVHRWVTQFRKTGDPRLVRGHELRGAKLARLRTLFEPGADDPKMYLCYLLTQKQQPYIERILGEELDLDTYDYYVEAYSEQGRVSRPRFVAATSNL